MTPFKLSLIFLLSLTLFTNFISAKHKNDDAHILDKTFHFLDKIENNFRKTMDWTKGHRQLLKSMAGMTLVMYGGQFSNTMLFVHALSVNGAPILAKSFDELFKTYKLAQVALKDQLPTILNSADQIAPLAKKLSNLNAEIIATKQKYQLGSMTAIEFDKQTMRAQESIADLQKSIRGLSASANAFTHIQSSINPSHVQEIASAIYQTMIIGFAAVTSQTVATLTMGLNLGKIIFERGATLLHQTTHNLPIDAVISFKDNKFLDFVYSYANVHPVWMTATGKFAAQILGVTMAFLMKETTSVFSACSLGANMIVESFEEILDPQLKIWGFPTLRKTPRGAVALHTTLVALGCRYQLFPGTGAKVGLPSLIKLILKPILTFEIFLAARLAKKVIF